MPRLGACAWLLTFVVASGVGFAVPRVDHEANCTYKTLSWDDFRGPVVNGQQAAWIRSTVILEPFETDFERVDDGFVARPRFPAVYAYMDKLNSGVRTGARNDYTLAHEQRHFDITELHARQFAQEMAVIEGVGADRRAASEDLFDKVQLAYEALIERLGTMQLTYDGETGNGLRKKQQGKWAEKIADLLAASEPYPLR